MDDYEYEDLDDNGEISLVPARTRQYLYVPFIVSALFIYILCMFVLGWPKRLSDWLMFLVVFLIIVSTVTSVHLGILRIMATNRMRRYIEIQMGMSKYEVVAIMGNDFDKSFNKKYESFVWDLKRSGGAITSISNSMATTMFSLPADSRVAVIFEDEKVIAVRVNNVH